MRTLLFLAIIVIIFLFVISLRLFYKNQELISENQKHEIWYTMAFIDNLTGIYNRAAYNKHVSEIEESCTAEGHAIIVFDIDNFKAINDTRGHLAGDAVLQNVAKTLMSVFPSPHYNVYRIGGDEFAVLAEYTTEEQVIEHLLVLKDTLEENGDIRLSKGYSIIKGSVREAFVNADEMLYADKDSKKVV